MKFYLESIFPTVIGRAVINEVALSVLNNVKKYEYRQLDNDFNSSAAMSVRLNILDDFPDIKNISCQFLMITLKMFTNMKMNL